MAHWIIIDDHHIQCSNCDGVVQTNYSPEQWQHCPFCLAEMEGQAVVAKTKKEE